MLRLKRAALLVAALGFAVSCGGDDDAPVDSESAAGDKFPSTEGKGGTVIDLNGGSKRGKTRSCAKGGPGADLKCGGVEGDEKALGTTDCCETRVVPAGSYNRFNNSKYPARVDSFQLDTFLVTAGRFRAWVDDVNGDLRSAHPPAGAGAHPKIPNSGWRPEWNRFLPTSRSEVNRMFSREDDVDGNLACQFGTNIYEQGTLIWHTPQLEKEIKDSNTDEAVRAENTKEALDRKPLNCIPWHVLFAFCIWDGGRLPTDAEFGLAATGGSEQRKYPWGDIDPKGGAQIFKGRDDLPAEAPTLSAGKKYVNARLWDSELPNNFPDNYAYTWGTRAWSDPADQSVVNAAHVMPVGRRPAGKGKWGQMDLAGGMFEWMLDEGPIRPGTCENCANVNFPKPQERDPQARMDQPEFKNETPDGVDWFKGGARSIHGSAWDNAVFLANTQSEEEIEYYTSYPVLRTYRALGGRCARDN